ncbi:MAG: aconitate hydratase AcnA [Actinomycetota bacterium]|nr:aconitate hydratase AcnA [Actinomycetota bacterium]
MSAHDRPKARLDTANGPLQLFRLDPLAAEAGVDLARLPHTVKVLAENLLRREGSPGVSRDDVLALARWPESSHADVAFMPARILMQDFTGVPAVVDLAAMRSAMARAGGDAGRVNPLVPVDLVIDHSVQVDVFGRSDAFGANVEWEYRRNQERYAFLRWAEQAFAGFRVVPPGMGICHQVNLEHLGRVVRVQDGLAFPDTLVGTDSHTTMINGLGVLGWGVGGIEAEGCMLGQSLFMPQPVVVGVRMTGALPAGTTATDLVLTLTEMLRTHGVVGKFVEFFGAGLSTLTVEDRATMSNMCPEYGATAALFPVDHQTIWYLERTGRGDVVDLVERYTKEQGLFRTDDDPDPRFSEVLELDLSKVEPSVAGPKRPQDRVSLPRVWESFTGVFGEAVGSEEPSGDRLDHGSVVIAAITSCTNTSNPSVMVAAGLMAKRAVEAGLQVKPWVKTSLAPGSRVVTDYLDRSGLQPYLDKLGFELVGYGCTTCIGNSGPLPEDIAREVDDRELVVAAVLSGNRNFEGRIHPQVRASYLASPPLVVAYALAGSVTVDLASDPLGNTPEGQPVYMRDLWPTAEEVLEATASAIGPEQFEDQYGRIFQGDEHWAALSSPSGPMYEWDPSSTYVREPPFFDGLDEPVGEPQDVVGARVLEKLGDSITTDHISPAGSIKADSPAGRWLQEHGVAPPEFNSYGSRRGNHEVMVRGTFANVRLRNQVAPETEGPWTTHFPSGDVMTVYDAAERYRSEGVPLIVLAGKEYGSGSSRDWAAKGPSLLGVRAAIAESFERIHRSNLVGMGILPLQYRAGENAETLGLTGRESFDVRELSGGLEPRQEVEVVAQREDGSRVAFRCVVRIDGRTEIEYYRNGGILRTVLRQMLGGVAGR